MRGYGIFARLKSILGHVLGGQRGYVTADEVMEQTGASPEKLQEWNRRGVLRPYVRMGQNLYRPEQVDVAHWLIREAGFRSRQRLVAAAEPASESAAQRSPWRFGEAYPPHDHARNPSAQPACQGLEDRDQPNARPGQAQDREAVAGSAKPHRRGRRHPKVRRGSAPCGRQGGTAASKSPAGGGERVVRPPFELGRERDDIPGGGGADP